ncbi:MAG: ABC transporter permease [Eubacterium sp.]|nr:ABC transporter permease [Eubacterium sp.]
MWIIAVREFRNYLKNPIYWLGMLIVIGMAFQQLAPYLKLYEAAPQESAAGQSREEMLTDGDIMDGYVPSTKAQQLEAACLEVRRQLLEEAGYTEEEAEAVYRDLSGRDFSDEEFDAYLQEQYGFYNGYWIMQENALHPGTAEEIDAYIQSKMQEHPYSYYFARKFADFSGLFLGFFSSVLLALLYARDTKGDLYELLHTKPIAARAYIAGKAAGGMLGVLLVLGVLNVVFGILCQAAASKGGFLFRCLDLPAASLCYIVPNLLMIVSVYTVVSLLFKSPYPAMPLLFVYQVYSNMGSRDANGRYGYFGRPLAIMVRFPGRLLDTVPPPMAVYNQIFLLVASALLLLLSVWIWKRRRVY